MRIVLLLWFSILLCSCEATSSPTADAPLRTCSAAFDAIKPEHAIAESDSAISAAVDTCEYARIETLAGFVCDVDIAQHPPGGPSIDNQLYGVRVPTMTAMLDAEFYGDDLATQFQHARQAGGSRQKSPDLCRTLLEEYPGALATREIALRRLGKSGRY
jgi:hypothetical protein